MHMFFPCTCIYMYILVVHTENVVWSSLTLDLCQTIRIIITAEKIMDLNLYLLVAMTTVVGSCAADSERK